MDGAPLVEHIMFLNCPDQCGPEAELEALCVALSRDHIHVLQKTVGHAISSTPRLAGTPTFSHVVRIVFSGRDELAAFYGHSARSQFLAKLGSPLAEIRTTEYEIPRMPASEPSVHDARKDLDWVARNMPLTNHILNERFARVGKKFSDVKLALCVHLDSKTCFALIGLLRAGMQLFVTTCNSATVRNEQVEILRGEGAIVNAWLHMSESERLDSIRKAIEWEPTHLCEMGGDLTQMAASMQGRCGTLIQASLEATGSGISKLEKLAHQIHYPIFNWDDVPIKEGLHNRYMVGISTVNAYFHRTKLTFHEKRVLVIGFGLVGQGVADAVRSCGGLVVVAELSPARVMAARYAGYGATNMLSAELPNADVVITATGIVNVLSRREFAMMKDGVHLINVGHLNGEIDVDLLYSQYPHATIYPFVEEVHFSDQDQQKQQMKKKESTSSSKADGGTKRILVFSDGNMANLSAGDGDSLNSFDVTLAVMIEGIHFIVSDCPKMQDARVCPLPSHVWGHVASAHLLPKPLNFADHQAPAPSSPSSKFQST